MSLREDPLAEAVVGPYRRRAAAELARTRFASLLSERCQADLLDWLVLELRAYARAPLDALVARRLGQASALWEADGRLAPHSEVERARRGLADELRTGGGDALDELAPLLRQELARQVGRFVFATSELCERLWRERRAVATLLSLGDDPPDIGPVTGIDLTRGDPHDGGRRSCVVTCAAGRFAYKPHDCRIDRWLADVAERHLPGALRQPLTIPCEDGAGAWAIQEFVRREPVADAPAVGRYWRNMGRALALFQALGSEDLHFENFVAAGERPSLVDAEAVLAGALAPRGDALTHPGPGRASGGFGRDLAGTIAASSLLPGLLERGHNVSPLLERGAACLPLCAGEERDVLGFEDELLAGLDEGLATLARHADGLARDVRAAAELPVRRLFRDTNSYRRMLERLRRADAYRPEVRRALLAALRRPQEGGGQGPSPLVAREAASLDAGDVPYFWHRAASRTVHGAGGGSDGRLLATSATERALGRIASLDAPRRSFARAVVGLSLRQAQLPTGEPLPACVPAHEPLGPREAVAEAEGILRTLEGMLVTSPSGEPSWLFRSRSTGCLERSTVCLADGLGGMAVFFAALATRAEDPRARQLALERLEGCLGRVDEALECLGPARLVPAGASLGMTDGLGGIVRSLDLVARMLAGAGTGFAGALGRADASLGRLLEVAARADVGRARGTSVYAGCAGLLLAVAQCGRARTGAQAALGARLVDRLLALRTLPAGDVPLWDTAGAGRPVSGLGNGQAGVAAALVAAVAAFGPDALAAGARSAAEDALSWELSCYRASLGTWLDLRRASAPGSYLHGVCSGAPGLGLAGLLVAGASDDGRVRALARRIVSRADGACATLPLGSRDRLCCGTLSVAEYLVSRGDLERAGRVLGGVVERARARGGYTFAGAGIRRTDEPDLLTGLAGVGYELLRLADPTLPGVFVG